ncbi:hypothetical protein AVEN_140013-1 [Araneus ventricosus]|uniref:Uncharacterized protein n=1 Tax=Araneus ventricosus TaxID=182803 RepID=A0A4Y2U371_ARAVE|nr:hypothetical protein AVEN_140013-1 [Araneus ventricosus]
MRKSRDFLLRHLKFCCDTTWMILAGGALGPCPSATITTTGCYKIVETVALHRVVLLDSPELLNSSFVNGRRAFVLCDTDFITKPEDVRNPVEAFPGCLCLR